MKPLLCFLIILFPLQSFAHGGGEASIEIGADKGVLEVKPDKSFKLSPEAIKRFGLKTEAVAPGVVVVPKKAIAHSLAKAQIYRSREGWLREVDFQIVNRTELSVTIRSKDLVAGDGIIVSGVGYLRMISAQLGKVEEEEDEHDDHSGHEDEHSAKKSEDDHDDHSGHKDEQSAKKPKDEHDDHSGHDDEHGAKESEGEHKKHKVKKGTHSESEAKKETKHD